MKNNGIYFHGQKNVLNGLLRITDERMKADWATGLVTVAPCAVLGASFLLSFVTFVYFVFNFLRGINLYITLPILHFQTAQSIVNTGGFQTHTGRGCTAIWANVPGQFHELRAVITGLL